MRDRMHLSLHFTCLQTASYAAAGYLLQTPMNSRHHDHVTSPENQVSVNIRYHEIGSETHHLIPRPAPSAPPWHRPSASRGHGS